MYKKITNAFAAVALVLGFTLALNAQQAAPSPQKTDDEPVIEKNFKGKIFEIKHRDPDGLAKVLRPLGSGFIGAGITPNSEFKTLTVRDFPENVAAIEDALKRLDTPAAAKPNIDLHMYVLIASNSAGTTNTAVPAELKDVIPQLRTTLSYKSYNVATSIVQRLTETQNRLDGRGTMTIPNPLVADGTLTLPYEYQIKSVSTSNMAGASSPTVQIGNFLFLTGTTSGSTVNNGTQVQTAINLRDGEKVVVGTAALGDRALIIVLTAKLLK